MFERLRQGDSPTKRAGLGLGLAIARHIIELHHGEITAESQGLGKGATFTVTLPLIPRPSSAHLPIATPERGAGVGSSR